MTFLAFAYDRPDEQEEDSDHVVRRRKERVAPESRGVSNEEILRFLDSTRTTQISRESEEHIKTIAQERDQALRQRDEAITYAAVKKIKSRSHKQQLRELSSRLQETDRNARYLAAMRTNSVIRAGINVY